MPPPSLALGVFAKEPTPGRVKTRLAAETSPDFAAAVARAFLLDTLDALAGLPADRFVAFDPPGAGDRLRELVPAGYRLVPQAAGDLGARLRGFCADRFAEGFAAAVLVGADSPSLPPEYVREAIARLARGPADVVLGPATDGGYYLLGLRTLAPIFDGIDWGSAAVIRQTVERLAAAGVPFALLPPWYDVDTAADLALLTAHLAALHASVEGLDPAPRTRRLLSP